MKVLVTGACGFAGSHITEEILSNPENEVVALDCLTYAGRLDRLAHLDRSRIHFVCYDFRFPFSSETIKQIGHVDAIIHNGAESHVARSFINPRIFVESNILGTLHVLEAARKLKPKKVIYVSTDEVFGPAYGEPFKENDLLQPTNPYAATKASGEFLAYSYFHSFDLPVVISRTMNMFGEKQNPEKCVPLMIKKILGGRTVEIHGVQETFEQGCAWTPGSRHWLHARNQANALCFLLENGTPGQKYNIGGEERTNLEIYHIVARTLGVLSQYEWAPPVGPIHDFSYALNDNKIRAMGWKPPRDFETSLRETVLWTRDNQGWLE
jgi:dTDP-glucose 4,6-dehydratase